jgi:cytochrome c-type biogenesis protein CcmH/NrfF
MTIAPGDGAGGDAALRAEHDALAQQLETRRSIDELRTAAYAGFATFLSLGLAIKFAWDRWGWSKLPNPPVRGRYPLLFLGAVLLFGLLAAVTVRAVRRARAHRRGEEALYARFRELRDRLGLDP